MLFNSTIFLVFLPIVFAVYWLLQKRLKWQNAFVVASSYLFYGWWDWRFLTLIAFTSFCAWGSGLLIKRHKGEKKAKIISVANIVLNLAILGVFKYYDFFVTSFATLFGSNPDGLLLKVILPVGISFYTFQALSYSIDVYRGKLAPTKDIVAFFAYVSFFPQLVAGPIERATNLLPQFTRQRRFNYDHAVDGIGQMIWGFFKKIVVADTCAVYVDQVFSTYQDQSGSTLLLAAVLFAFQIYGDFSGYSDIAIGVAKLFGISLMRNFSVPYFSRDIAEFWRRWHISLTTWFRDYIYIPLGGSRVSKIKVVRNTFIIFLISGLWHGANWTYVTWGAYHALLFMPLILLGHNRKYLDVVAANRRLPSLKEFGQMLLTFILAVFGWIIFRAQSVGQAWDYIVSIFNKSLFTMPWLKTRETYLVVLLGATFMLVMEWLNRRNPHGIRNVVEKPIWVRVVTYLILSVVIIRFSGTPSAFIYFAF